MPRRRSETEAVRAQPVDLAHLSRQTLGDADLRAEILAMFLGQLEAARARLPLAGADERGAQAHRLKGSARSLGAFALAVCAEAVEAAPLDAGALERLLREIDEVHAFVAAMER